MRTPTILSAPRLAASLAFVVALGGCYVQRLEPVHPVPIALSSREPFLVEQASGGAVPRSCLANYLRAGVVEQRADTLHLRDVRLTQQPRGEADCIAAGPAWVVLSRHPQLRAETHRFSAGRTTLAIASWVAMLLVLGFVLELGDTYST